MAKTPADSKNYQDRAVPMEMGTVGVLHVDPSVTNRIIREAALSVPGCTERAVGMGHITGNTLPQADVTADGPYIAAEVHIAVSWPSPVAEVARTVRETVRTHLEVFLDAKVTEIDIFVDDVTCAPAPGSKMRPERVTFADLAQFDPTPTLPATQSTVEPAVEGGND